MKFITFYHANCADGRMAAAVATEWVSEFYGLPVQRNILRNLTVPINYDSHKIPPIDYYKELKTKIKHAAKHECSEEEFFKLFFSKVNGTEEETFLMFVDFAPTPEQTAQLVKDFAGHIRIFDHHLTAKKAYIEMTVDGDPVYRPEPVIDRPSAMGEEYSSIQLFAPTDPAIQKLGIFFSDKDSGALLTYKILYLWNILSESKSIPDFIRWVSDRDLWTFKFPETKHFDAGMSLYKQIEPGFLIRHIETTGVDTILAEGKAVLAANEAYVRSHVPRIKTVVNVTRVMFGTPTLVPFQKDGLEVVRIAMYNCTHLASELCAGYFESQNEVHVMIAYTIIGQDEVICQMRSRAGYPVSFIAEMFGGGGHENACAFTITMAELLHALETSDLIAPSPTTDS